jgi:hypothetical protein
MDGMILLIAFALALVQLPEPQRLPRIRLPRLSLISFRQWRTVRRQRIRDRAFWEAMARIDENESERVRAVIIARAQNELPISEEAFHA